MPNLCAQMALSASGSQAGPAALGRTLFTYETICDVHETVAVGPFEHQIAVNIAALAQVDSVRDLPAFARGARVSSAPLL